MSLQTGIKVNYYHLLFLVLVILLVTVARVTLLFIAPIVIVILLFELKLHVRHYVIILILIIIINYLLSLTNGLYLKYNLLSFYYVIPFILFLFAKPGQGFSRHDLLSIFINILTVFVIVNNIVGVVQYIHFPNDDSFSGIYGHFTVTQNGLTVVNSILFFYYLRKFQIIKAKKYIFLSIFFAISAVMGFYGGGMIVLLGAFLIFTIRFNFSKIIKTVLVFAVVFSILYFLTGLISPDTLRYNRNIVNRFIGDANLPMPRKILSYKNYVEGYTSNIKDFLFGSGPGTFNSRSAFIVGSPEYFKLTTFLKSDEKPYYFENYAYVLWNAKNTVQYQDGFMNQPFSSLLAFLGEYGFIFFFCLLGFYLKQYKAVLKYEPNSKKKSLYKDLYKFCSIYLALLLIIDNYAEYPEITILIILIMKLAERELAINQKAITSASHGE